MELPDSNSPYNGGEGRDAGGDYLKAEGRDKCQGQDKRPAWSENFSHLLHLAKFAQIVLQ